MADIRNREKFLQGRVNWTANGYETGFPRGCQFSDLDAIIEFDGQSLVIEGKHHDGIDSCPYPPMGQLLMLRFLKRKLGRNGHVFALYMDAEADSPWALRILGETKSADVWKDWRKIESIEERRRLLKEQIDLALRLI